MLFIDGTTGEGGGQVVRTSLALSAITGRPFHIENIRAKRSRPGLLRQHLTAVNAMAEVCQARVEGAELYSKTLSFFPGKTHHGDYTFSVGTAGSATLVLQTVLPPLILADGHSRLVFEGGTHNPMAPPFDFLHEAFMPLLRRMGVAIRCKLEVAGFYPKGGGRFEVEIRGGAAPEPLFLLERGPIERVSIHASVSQIPMHVAEREVATLAGRLADLPDLQIQRETTRIASPGPGNVVTVTVHAAHVTELFAGFGERGVPAERIAHRVANEVRTYLAANEPVGEHLADQLLIPLALAGGGEFSTVTSSLHTTTNAQIIERFIPGRLEVDAEHNRVRAFGGSFSRS